MKTLFSILLLTLPLLTFAQQTGRDTGTLNTGYRDQAGATIIPREKVDIDPTAEALQATIYELSDEYYAVHQMHWNLTGPLFYELHIMYQEFYEAIAEQIDILAERKLSLDRPADARPAAVAQNANLTPATPEGFVTDKQTLEVLATRHLEISNRLADRIETTNDTDPTTSNLLQETKHMIDHQMWMMRSHVK